MWISFREAGHWHLNRELESLKRERTGYRNRNHGILMQQGLRIPDPSKKSFVRDLEAMLTWDGQKLPVGMKARLGKAYQQLRLVEDQVSTLTKEKRELLKEAENPKMRQVVQPAWSHWHRSRESTAVD